jgi:hypothetical protein
MPCDSISLTEQSKARQRDALRALAAALATGTAGVKVGPQGAIAFTGWKAEREGLTDLCAFRRLSSANDPALRRALARAEAVAGRKVDPRAMAAGVHSHDGGGSWGTH